MDIFQKLAHEVYQILRSFGKTIILYDQDGREVYDSYLATRFFVKPDKMMVSIVNDGDDRTLTLYLSNTQDTSNLEKLISSMRQTSNRFNVIFAIKKYGKELSPKDFAFGNLNEAKLYGDNKTSYQDIGSIRIVIEHANPITSDSKRSYKIDNIYVENTVTNERHKMPSKMLSPARAMARHLSEGGKFDDRIGKIIRNLSEELTAIKNIKRRCKNAIKTHIDENEFLTNTIANTNVRLSEIRNTFSIIKGSRNYHRYFNIFDNNNIFEYTSPNTTKLKDIIGEENQQYFDSILGERVTRFPIIELKENDNILIDIKSLTRSKQGIDFDIKQNAIKIYDSECFSELLDMLSNLNKEYVLIVEESTMDDYTVAIDVADPELRNNILNDIKNDFSYSDEDVGPIGETKIGFKDADIRSALEDYIHVYAPEASDVDLDDKPEEDQPSEDDNSPEEDDEPTVENKELSEYLNWVNSHDVDLMAEAAMDIPEFDSKENAIHNSPDLFDVNEFLKFDYNDDHDIIPQINDYLYSKVKEQNDSLDVTPDDFTDTSKGLFIRIVKPKMERDSAITESNEDNVINLEAGNMDYVIDKNKISIPSIDLEIPAAALVRYGIPDLMKFKDATGLKKDKLTNAIIDYLKSDDLSEDVINEADLDPTIISSQFMNQYGDDIDDEAPDGVIDKKSVDNLIRSFVENNPELSFNDITKIRKIVTNGLKSSGIEVVKNKTSTNMNNIPSVRDEGAMVMTPDGLGTVIGPEIKRRSVSGRKFEVIRVKLIGGDELVYDSQDLKLMPKGSSYSGLDSASGDSLKLQHQNAKDTIKYSSNRDYDVMSDPKNVLSKKEKGIEESSDECEACIQSCKDRFADESEEEPTNELTDDEMVDNFMDSKYNQNVLSKKEGNDIGESWIVDQMSFFMDKNHIDLDYDGMVHLLDLLKKKYTEQGFNVINDEDVDESAEQIPMNSQTSFIDDVKSDKVFNPHQNKFGQADDNNADDMMRLKALAGLGF